jgi:hypothetical protein
MIRAVLLAGMKGDSCAENEMQLPEKWTAYIGRNLICLRNGRLRYEHAVGGRLLANASMRATQCNECGDPSRASSRHAAAQIA